MFKFWTIVLVSFPFTDLSSSKLRPALIISKESQSDDVILAFVSSNNNFIENSIIINSKDKIFKESWLKTQSTVRLDKIATLDKKVILWELWVLPKEFLEKHKTKFFNIFWF